MAVTYKCKRSSVNAVGHPGAVVSGVSTKKRWSGDGGGGLRDSYRSDRVVSCRARAMLL